MGAVISALLFQPPRTPTPLSNYIWLKTRNGARIPAVFIPCRRATCTILYSHGNAEDLGMIYNYLTDLGKALNANIMAYDYTGYGLGLWNKHNLQKENTNNSTTTTTSSSSSTNNNNNQRTISNSKTTTTKTTTSTAQNNTSSCSSSSSLTKPSESNVYADIDAAYDFLINGPPELVGPPDLPILLYGRSLGSGPSCYLAQKLCQHKDDKLKGLILHSPFTSVCRVVVDLGVTIRGDPFPNSDRLAHIRCPVFIIHGTKDGIVPCAHGMELHACLNPESDHEPFWAQGMGHNNIEADMTAEFVARLRDFITRTREETSRAARGRDRHRHRPAMMLLEAARSAAASPIGSTSSGSGSTSTTSSSEEAPLTSTTTIVSSMFSLSPVSICCS